MVHYCLRKGFHSDSVFVRDFVRTTSLRPFTSREQLNELYPDPASVIARVSLSLTQHLATSRMLETDRKFFNVDADARRLTPIDEF